MEKMILLIKTIYKIIHYTVEQNEFMKSERVFFHIFNSVFVYSLSFIIAQLTWEYTEQSFFTELCNRVP